MKTLLLTLLLLPLTVLGQSLAGTGVHRGSFLHDYEYWVSGALTFYIETTGDDLNDCLSVSTPCLTLQGAIDKTPRQVRSSVIYNMGSGNFAGGDFSGFTLDYGYDPTNGAFVQVNGTLATATVATGTATGTATSGTAGSGSTFGTLVDSGQSWTSNDLRGKIINITGGTGSGQQRIVQTNDATTITVTGTWTAPDGTSTYTVQDWDTVINTVVPRSKPNSFTSASAAGYAFIVQNSATGVNAPFVLNTLSVTATRGIFISGPTRLDVYLTSFTGQSTGVTACNSSVIRWNDSYIDVGSISYVSNNCSYGGAKAFTTTRTLWRSSAGAGTAFALLYPVQVFVSLSAFENMATALGGWLYTYFGVFNSRFDTVTTAIRGSQASGNHEGATRVNASVTNFASCGTVYNLSGGDLLTETAAITGTGNTLVYDVNTGAKAKLHASSTVTGTTEIDVDGNTYTRAALQALSPKRITDLSTLSTIWEP